MNNLKINIQEKLFQLQKEMDALNGMGCKYKRENNINQAGIRGFNLTKSERYQVAKKNGSH